MNIIDIIEAKKQKKTLSEEEIQYWIDGMMNGSIEDYQTTALLMAICLNGFNEQESYYLTQSMLHSGEALDLSCFGKLSVDKHSTGGVGDSTTFIVIPVLAALGYKCAKASGRGLGHTGGTLDKLESLPGLSINISGEDFYKQVSEIGLAVVGQNKDVCPADKKLYALRDVTATVDNYGLISSSIMSKKLASGAQNIVLDVKCGRGAFMKDVKSATVLAERMVNIGKLANRNISAVITNMDYPLDNYIGNSLEILGALNVLNGEKNDLYKVSVTLASVLLTSMGVDDAKDKCEEVIASGKALEKFKEMLKYQGGDMSYIDHPEKLSASKYAVDVLAEKDGYVVDIEPIQLAKSVQAMGGGRVKATDTIDLYCGIKINVNINSKVSKGDVIATMYYAKQEYIELYDSVQKAFKISDTPIETPKLIYKIIQ